MSHPYAEHRRHVQKMAKAMQEIAGATELTREQMEGLGALFNPRLELLERLNIRLKGGDPGEPFNWRGERGM